MKVELYYIVRRYEDYKGETNYIFCHGPFGTITEAIDKKEEHKYTSVLYDIVTQIIDVEKV